MTALDGRVEPTVAQDEPGAEEPHVEARHKRRRMSPWHFMLFPIAVLFLVPFAQMLLASFSPAKDLVTFPPPFFPSHFTLDGYAKLFTSTDIFLWLRNTVIVSAAAVISNIVLCSLAGYGFARLRFAGRNFGFFLVLATIMIPTQLLMIPTYILFAKLGLLNGLGAAIVPWLATAFGVFLMRQTFKTIPRDFEEAALVDGATPLQILWRVLVPLAKPGLIAFSIVSVTAHWNEFLWPLMATTSPDNQVLTVGLASFARGAESASQWGVIAAGTFLVAAPLLIAFILFQRRFVSSFVFTGIK